MSEVYDLLFDLFDWVVNALRSVPVTDNVSLFDFSFALLIIGIVLTGLVVAVKSASVHSYVSKERSDARAARSSRGKGS